MSTHYFVATKSEQGSKKNPIPFTTIDEALRSASVLLEDGEPSVWIVDSDGNLVMPADQVRVRLNRSSGTSHPTI